MWHFCKNPCSIAAAERRFLGRSALPWPADLVAPLDVRCRVLWWVGTLCSGICRNFNKSEANKAFVKSQRHNCPMKSLSFGFYAQLSVVCMWLSQYIDFIYTIHTLYIHQVCFIWSIHQPLGLKGLVFETAPNEKKKKQDGRSGRPGTRSPTRRQPKSDVWHYRYEALEAPMPVPMPFSAVQHPFAVWVLLKVEVPWLFFDVMSYCWWKKST